MAVKIQYWKIGGLLALLVVLIGVVVAVLTFQ